MKLEVQNANYSFTKDGRRILNAVSFSMDQGSLWCLAGPNGTGKSTFLKLISGLLDLTAFEGSVKWTLNGVERDVHTLSRMEVARSIAYVPGVLHSNFSISVAAFVAQGRFAHSGFFARGSAHDDTLTQAAMERVGVASIASRMINEISAGEVQLVLLARALCQQPQALVLDEATSNLDLRHQASIFSLLSDLNREGMTILMVGHDLNLASEFCNNLAWMKDGAITATGTMKEMLTTDRVKEIYGPNTRTEVGQNPFTGQPKIFYM